MSVFSDLNIFFKANTSQGDSKLVARGSVVVGGVAKVNFSVLNGSNGRFVSLPSEKSTKVDETGKPKYFPIVSLTSRELSDELNRLVLSELDGSTSSVKPKSTTTKGSRGIDALPF